MPAQKPGRSKQDYATDREFMRAVIKRFGEITVDLAATSDNAVCENYITPEEDTFKANWIQRIGLNGIGWLNPEYSWILPWAKKCRDVAVCLPLRASILFLVPASVGSNWFEQYVAYDSRIIFLKPRLTFEGHKHPYPKDLMLCRYTQYSTAYLDRDREYTICEIWNWKKDLQK